MTYCSQKGLLNYIYQERMNLVEKSIFKVIDWHEEFTIEEKIAHAKATYKIEGALTGQIQVDYSIYYLNYNKEEIHASSSRFEGFMLFEGNIGEKQGSFVLYDRGSFINNQYEANVSIVKGSGTGEFFDISGEGTYYPANDGMLLELKTNIGE